MNFIRVSVIIPTYNSARYLPEALESVLNQTYSDFEVLVMDDGSTDETTEVVKPYLDDHRVAYHAMEHRGGRRAFNDGVAIAKGTIIGQCDADDRLAPNKLALQMKLFDESPDIGLVYSDMASIDEHGNIIMDPSNRYQRYEGSVTERLIERNFVPGPTSLIRKSIFQKGGGFDPSFGAAQDYDLWLRLSTLCEFRHVNESLYFYRRHNNQISTSNKEQQFAMHVEALHKFSRNHPDRVSDKAIAHATAEIKKNLGHYYLKSQRNKPLARQAFVEAIRLRPTYFSAWNRLLRSYFQTI